ncbi:hypothetical protein PSFL_02190 [Pseudomonas sp. DD1]
MGEGQRADHDVLGIHHPPRQVAVQYRLDVAITQEGKPLLPANRQLQGLARQLYRQLLAEQRFTPTGLGGVLQQLFADCLRVVPADVHLADQPWGAMEQALFPQDVVFGQPLRNVRPRGVAQGQATLGRGGEVVDRQFAQAHGLLCQIAAAQVSHRDMEGQRQVVRLHAGLGVVAAHLLAQGAGGEGLQVFDAGQKGRPAGLPLQARLVQQPLAIGKALLGIGCQQPGGQRRLQDRLQRRVRRGGGDKQGHRVAGVGDLLLQGAYPFGSRQTDGLKVVQLLVEQ